MGNENIALGKTRVVRFPLKLKLLALMIILIASSLIIFVGIALKTFKEDKSAYIFETLLNKAASQRLLLSHQLSDVAGEEASFQVMNGKLLLGDTDPSELLEKALNDNSNYSLSLIVPQHNEFYRWKSGNAVKVSPEEEALLSNIFSDSIHQVVKELELNGEKWLYAYDYHPEQHFIYVASLSQEDAYAVTRYLINRSIYYGLFVLGAAMLLSVLLARPLTSQLELLFGMTQEIAKGNFQKRIQVKGHDEVGALSDSVNDMADKIVQYMEEMKEKARLENEVAVAQLVQSSFFPRDNIDERGMEVHGHFEPATECGGDWWGVSNHGDWSIFFIADATGHGVPAALLTATINCCKTSLSFLMEARPELASRPDEILRYMNQAVSEAGKEIQVTCFVATYNNLTREFIYSNSSHTPPLLFKPQEGKLEKENFRPLIEANGPRLGQSLDSKFNSYPLKLGPHDIIFLYTDGLTEAEDPSGTQWGQRRLIKSLIQNGLGSPQEIIAGVLGDLKNFISSKPKDDDITAVALRVKA